MEGHESNIEIDETALNTIVDQMVKELYEVSSVTDIISYLPGYTAFLKTCFTTHYVHCQEE